jgi:NAD(P)-dependent dehydrogenase (short-subunit alcohol dehydrogenase family)
VAEPASPDYQRGCVVTGRLGVMLPERGEPVLRAPPRGASVSGATEALTRALALELAPVRVNAVRPGPVRSSMWTDTVPDPQTVYDDFAGRSPLARVAGPDEIAAAYAFLMSSPNTTGTILTSDAGTVLV